MSSLTLAFNEGVTYSLARATGHWDIETKKELSKTQAHALTARVIGEMLPGGGLCRATLHAGRDLLEERVVVKWARTMRGADDLEHEAQYYERRLRALQGVVVPRCFGLFRGGAVAALVLQMCSGGNLRLPEDHDL